MPILPHLYFSHLQAHRENIFLWEKVSKQIRPLYWRELGTRVSGMARGLDAIGIGYQERIGILTEKSLNCFFAYLTTMTLGGVSVCFTSSCTMEERISCLRESNVKVVFVDNVDQAEAIYEHRGRLPALSHIVIMEAIGTARGEKPLLITFLELVDKGKSHPDRTITALKKIQPTDRALLLYSPSEVGPQALMQTHENLAAKLEMLSAAMNPLVIDKQDVLLIASSFHESPLHFAACMLPLLHASQAHYSEEETLEGLMMTTLNPTLIVGKSDFFNLLKLEALEKANDGEKTDGFVIKQALQLGRAHYERPNRLSFKEKIADYFLRPAFMRKFHHLMGSRLRAIISTDTNTPYDTQLFFYSFGVELSELTAE